MRNPVQRDGLGYVLDVPKDGVSIRADRIRESSGEITAELVVERAPDGHILRTRLNLLSATTRSSLAKDLSSRAPGPDWRKLLEVLCLGVVELEREGEPFQMIGRSPVRPEPPYLMRPMLFAGKPTILFGEGGVGKSSALAAAIAVSVASGQAAVDAWSVVTPGPVLVLDWEGDDGDWNDAVARIAAGMSIPPPLLHYRRMSGSLDGAVNEIAAYCDEHAIVLIVVDSVTWATRSMDRAAGIEEPAKRLFEALRHIGRSSLLIDHKSKAGLRDDESGSNPIGALVKVNAARASYELRRAGEPSADGTRHLALIARKLNPVAPQPPLGIAVRVTGGETRLWTEPVLLGDEVVVQQVKESGALWERIRDALLPGTPLTASQIVGRIGLDGPKDPIRTVENAMARKPAIFANAGGPGRDSRKWYLILQPGGGDVTVEGQMPVTWGRGDVPTTGRSATESPTGPVDNARDAPTDARAQNASMLRPMLADAPPPPDPPVGGYTERDSLSPVGRENLSPPVNVVTANGEGSRAQPPARESAPAPAGARAHEAAADWWEEL